MTDGVYEITSKQRLDAEPDYAAIADEMQALIDLADSFTK